MKQQGVLISVLLLCTFLIYPLSYADDNIINGCYKKNDGQLRIVSPESRCLPSEIPISWNKVGPSGPSGAGGSPGPQGPPGISVQSTPLPEDDKNCPNGGSLFTSVSGVTYACNGEGTEGPTITIRRMLTGQCSSDRYGWCPDGFYNSYFFHIRDSAVNEDSVIAINVFNPDATFYKGCEVALIKAGEFLILCNGVARIEKGAILHYAVFSPLKE